jgi:hypothetical protein
MTAVDAMLLKGVHSTWIIKNNTSFFPKAALEAVLRARYGTRPAGHWVVFRATISGVPLFAMIYGWSQKGLSFILSTCGSTEPHPAKYVSKFEDDYGGTSFKLLDRPSIAHFLYEYLPLIDEHNKQRQSLLGLERCWLTKDCWFRLLTTLVGMCVVDMHRWERNMAHKKLQKSRRSYELNEDDFALELVRVKKFSDLISSYLNKVELRKRATPRPAKGQLQDENSSGLVRIRDGDGKTRKAATLKQISQGRTKGSAKQQNCFICRKYLKADGAVQNRCTTWKCKDCGMPLCSKSRIGEPGREWTCYQEHKNAEDNRLACWTTDDGRQFLFPQELQVNLHPPASAARLRRRNRARLPSPEEFDHLLEGVDVSETV